MELIGAENLTENLMGKGKRTNPWYGAYVKSDHSFSPKEVDNAITKISADIVRKLIADGHADLIIKEPCGPEESPIGWSQDFWSVGIKFAVCTNGHSYCRMDDDGEK